MWLWPMFLQAQYSFDHHIVTKPYCPVSSARFQNATVLNNHGALKTTSVEGWVGKL